MENSKITKWVAGILGIVILLIVIFNFMGTSSQYVDSASTDISCVDNCSDTSGATLNETNLVCINTTGGYISTAECRELPLSSAFDLDGIIMLVFMGALIIGIGGLMLKKRFG